ncbi:MAG: UDP-N-acetylmuramoyl-L-alanine--D-glutamate ligase [Anaerolineaceae bacterium]|nr:UDP-N-acetylmuramoyl-L-alanine--D-glutamate ligase [Anaerolineaceae bacterium]
MKTNYVGKKVIVIGAARQGLAISRFLLNRGAQVILTDNRPAAELAFANASLADLPVEFAFGGHPESLLEGADVVCVSGGVPLTIPFLTAARNQGVQLSNDSQIFLEECPAPVIGITGSAGKSTTTALVGLMAQKHFEVKNSKHRAWVGGNIGNPLIEDLDKMDEDDLAVMELSSFQLELMSTSPQVAAVLNITPNHLDRHGSMQAYIEAKSRILRFQHQGDVAILNRDDQGSWDLLDQARTDVISFGMKAPGRRENGTFIENNQIMLQIGKDKLKMLPIDWINLRGEHNLYNVLAACAIAAGATISLPGIQLAVETFDGVPHRLELVRDLNGVRWYDDSIATAPERTIAAINSFDEPIVLLLGGRDKNLPWDKLAQLIRRRVSRVVIFGEAGDLIAEAIGPKKPGQAMRSVVRCATLQEAIKTAHNQAEAGDVVLLSPGGTSYDAFKDFEERGQAFREWVNQL